MVNLWWLDSTSGNLVDTGLQVIAWNWLHPDIFSNEKVIVSYDRQEDRWIVLAWDYTLRPQSLERRYQRMALSERIGLRRPLHDGERAIPAVGHDRQPGDALEEGIGDY